MAKKESAFLSVVLLTSLLGVAQLFAGGFGKPSKWCEPVNLGQPVNTEFDDTHPAISPTGLSLYFTSTNPTGFGGEDIWVSQRASLEDPWGEPQNLGSNINTVSNDLGPTISRDGHRMFFGSNRPEGGCGGGDLWVSWRKDPADDFGWESPANLGCIVNSTAADLGPSYYEDAKTGVITLYFASNRIRGGLDFDIFTSTLDKDGSWGAAVLVEELNTLSLDAGPDLRRNGLELYFQSNRPGSLAGRLDLWVSTRETTQDAWSKPVNLGPEVNTEQVEHGPSLTSDASALYFDSDRPGGFLGRDIYVATRRRLQ